MHVVEFRTVNTHNTNDSLGNQINTSGHSDENDVILYDYVFILRLELETGYARNGT